VTLGNPTLTSELKERLAAGITAETAGRGIAELAAWRDRFLVDLLALRAGQKYRAPNDDHVVVVSQGCEKFPQPLAGSALFSAA
jgi:hypothetical protein